MAFARILRTWADESACELEVGCDETFPDAVAEVVAAVLRLDREACGDDTDDDTATTLSEFETGE